MCGISRLIIAMLDNSKDEFFICIIVVYLEQRIFFEILGEDLIHDFKNIIIKNGYIISLNDLGNKECNNIETLFRLKRLLK